MSSLRIVVLATADKSDLFFANEIDRNANTRGIVIESPMHFSLATRLRSASRLLAHPTILIKKLMALVSLSFRRHFAIYSRPSYRTNFGWQGTRLAETSAEKAFYTPNSGDINSQETIAHIRQLRPDVIAVCGTSILCDEIIAIPRFGVLNLHGGLSQRYRGLFTTEFAVYNDEPEYIGATVHYVSAGIDDGDVVYQGRPDIDPDDNPHTLYEKIIRLGVDMMLQAMTDIENGTVDPRPLSRKGDLYSRRMFTPAIRTQAWRKIEQGLIADYLSEKHRRDRRVKEILTNDYRSARNPTFRNGP